MNWKVSLDRYLTSEPDSSFDCWIDLVFDNMTDEFFTSQEDWILENYGQCDKWLNKLFNKAKEPEQAAAIIERAHRRYIK